MKKETTTQRTLNMNPKVIRIATIPCHHLGTLTFMVFYTVKGITFLPPVLTIHNFSEFKANSQMFSTPRGGGRSSFSWC
jgi:hypothetical protein